VTGRRLRSDCAAVLLNLANRQRGFLIVHIFPGRLAVGTSLSIIAVILIGDIAGPLQFGPLDSTLTVMTLVGSAGGTYLDAFLADLVAAQTMNKFDAAITVSIAFILIIVSTAKPVEITPGGATTDTVYAFGAAVSALTGCLGHRECGWSYAAGPVDCDLVERRASPGTPNSSQVSNNDQLPYRQRINLLSSLHGISDGSWGDLDEHFQLGRDHVTTENQGWQAGGRGPPSEPT
jgi:hypothetical protein